MIDAGKYMEWLTDNYPDSGKRKKYFYVIETPLGLKIGITNNLTKRWSSAYKQTAKGFKRVYGPYPHCEVLETSIKRKFKSRSGSSETFDPSLKSEIYLAVDQVIQDLRMNEWK